jgi:hypothetical protein
MCHPTNTNDGDFLSVYNIKFQEIAKSSEVLVGQFKAKCEEEAELCFQLEQVSS